MSGQVVYASSTTHVNRDLRADFGELPEQGFVATAVSLDRDEEIESSSFRADLSHGEGAISILLTAGDAIGEFSITVQYEGELGEHELCLKRQGHVLNAASDWIKEILKEFATDWEVDFTTSACPHGDTRLLRLGEAIECLTEGRIRKVSAVPPGPGPDGRAVERHIDIKGTL